MKYTDYVPSSESTIPEEINGAKCIGIVYSTDMAGTDTGKENGYVVSITSENTKWGNSVMTTYPDVDNGNAEIANAAKQALVNDIEGYTLTNTLKNIAKEKNITVDVLNKLADFPVLGDNTSGWYIPTPGQLWSMLVNLGEYTGSGDVFGETDDRVAKRNAVLKMNEKITGTTSSTPVRGNAFGEFTWSSVEANATNMWAAKFNAWADSNKGKISLDKSRPKGQSQQLRPVFAF